MEPNIIFGLINIFSASLIIGVSIPLVKHKIKMNHFYGIRIKKAFESEENWYKVNEYGGKQLIIWSSPMILVGFICFLVPINDSNKDILSFVFGVFPITLCIAVAVIKIYAYAKRI
ncbi:MAG TPA: SdpI family protein [Desulfobacterales bacterium]